MTSEKLLRFATYASVATASVLIMAKVAAWLLTGSVSVMASLVDSLMDACASLINLLAVRYALTPADREHRFGHGKAEALAGLAQATFIAGSAIFLMLHAVERVLIPQPLAHLGGGMLVIVFSMLATAALLAVQRRAIRRTGSTAIRADALHYATDLVTNGAALLALFLAVQGVPQADAYFGLAIGAFILFSAGRIGLQAVALLMDRELPEAERETIRSITMQTPKVLGIHGLRTWRSGLRNVIQMHLELQPDIPLLQAHRISLEVERRLLEHDADADITIHQDPAGFLAEDDHNTGDRFR